MNIPSNVVRALRRMIIHVQNDTRDDYENRCGIGEDVSKHMYLKTVLVDGWLDHQLCEAKQSLEELKQFLTQSQE